jgi:histidinol-phosphate aminotransferase
MRRKSLPNDVTTQKHGHVLAELFLPAGCLDTPGYAIDVHSVQTKLDQNEHPSDWPRELKTRVMRKLLKQEWNRYPEPHSARLRSAVATYVGVSEERVLLGASSSQLIGLIVSALAHGSGRTILATPSFPLYERVLGFVDRRAETWRLSADFKFDLGSLTKLRARDVLILASPNNPTGSFLAKADLLWLLERNPMTLFIVDAAYAEFAPEDYTNLLGRFDNLLLLRTVSKALGGAGIRVGFALGDPKLMRQLSKLEPPYALNRFALTAVTCLLEDREALAWVAEETQKIIAERDRLVGAINELNADVDVFDSAGNFLLLRFRTAAACRLVYDGLVHAGVLIRDVSPGAGLERCLRVTIGSRDENQHFLNSLQGCSITTSDGK